MEELMQAKTIFEQTGWERPHYAPEKICQDIKALEKVYEHDFDLNDNNFRNYLATRGVCSFKNLESCGEGWKTLDKHIDMLMNWSDQRFLDDPSTAYSISGLKFDEEHKQVSLKIFHITKGAIQDSWELYKANEVF